VVGSGGEKEEVEGQVDLSLSPHYPALPKSQVTCLVKASLKLGLISFIRRSHPMSVIKT